MFENISINLFYIQKLIQIYKSDSPNVIFEVAPISQRWSRRYLDSFCEIFLPTTDQEQKYLPGQT